MNLSALVQDFWYLAYEQRSKFELNQSFLGIYSMFSFALFWFGFKHVLRTQFSTWLQAFHNKHVTIDPKICLKPWFHQYFLWFHFVWFQCGFNPCFVVTIKVPSLITYKLWTQHFSIALFWLYCCVWLSYIWFCFSSNNCFQVTSLSTFFWIPNVTIGQ